MLAKVTVCRSDGTHARKAEIWDLCQRIGTAKPPIEILWAATKDRPQLIDMAKRPTAIHKAAIRERLPRIVDQGIDVTRVANMWRNPVLAGRTATRVAKSTESKAAIRDIIYPV